MAITLFIFLFSIAFIALIGAFKHVKKISTTVFACLLVGLLVFNFALISLDKIYFLHHEQDHLFLEKLRLYDESISHKVEVQKQLNQLQLDMALELMAQNTAQENEASIQQKLKWRDQLTQLYSELNIDAELIKQNQSRINHSVHAYLMEALNKQLIQDLGHRAYSEYVRSRPRDEWTDELFVKELKVFLKEHSLDKPNIELAIKRIEVFEKGGELMPKS